MTIKMAEEKRDKAIYIRVTEQELKSIKESAKLESLMLSNYVRQKLKLPLIK